MLANVISRFSGSNFILYGGDEDHIATIREHGGNVIAWFTGRADLQSVPVKEWYGNLFNTIYNAIYLIVTNGNMGRRKVETSITSILNHRNNGQGIVILHGYDGFDPTGLRVLVEPYNGGVIVGRADDRTNVAMRTRKALSLSPGRELEPIHIPMDKVDPSIIPYIHLYDRIMEDGGAIPIGDDLPLEPSSGSSTIVEYESLRSWRMRRLLVSTIEALTTMYDGIPDEDRMGITILFLDSNEISFMERVADMFVQYMPNLHMWGSGDFAMATSEYVTGEFATIHIRSGNVSMDEYVGQRVAIINYGPHENVIPMVDVLDPIMVWSTVPMMEPTQYLDGDLRLQPWTPTNGLTVSIISMAPYRVVTYEPMDAGEFQSIIRPSSYNVAPALGLGDDPIVDDEAGLCTCYDCAREVSIMATYLSHVGDVVDRDTLVSAIRANTTASRPYIGRERNRRTLWSMHPPRIGPADRRDLVLYRSIPSNVDAYESAGIEVSDMSLVNIPIRRYNTIMAYADGMDPDHVIRLIQEKGNTPTHVGPSTMASILDRDDGAILVNFHTDFTPNYDPSTDTGRDGARHYASYIQRVAISKVPMDPLTHLMLFSL